jgi:hypothetical protein
MKEFLRQKELLVPVAYLLPVSFGLYFAIPLTTENINWFFALILLTMPWGVITFFLILGSVHLGDGDSTGLFYISASAAINAFLLYLVARPKKKLNEKS